MHRITLTRRDLLAGAAAMAPGARYRPRLVSNTYIWVQQIQKTKRDPADVWSEAFPAIRRAGYNGVELIASSIQPPLRDLTFRLLKENNLHLNDIYNGGSIWDAELARKSIDDTLAIAETAHTVGTKVLLFDLNPKPKAARKSDAELAVEARSLNELGRRTRSIGMELYLHNHDDPMRDNAREWRAMLHQTDPKLVSFALDMDWAWNGGADPFELLYATGDRLRMLHLRTQRNKVWTEALQDGGDIDFGKVAAYLRKQNFDGFLVVELAHRPQTVVTRPVEENIRVSREWTEKVFHLRAAAAAQ